jgi:hypothetical protein
VIASRSSAADFPEKSAPVADLAALVARLAPFCAFCWRARAWPPFLAAARRLVWPERELDDDRLELDDERLEELRAPVPRPDVLRPDVLFELVLRRPPERDPDPDERRPPEDPPEPLDDSAIASPPSRYVSGGGRDYPTSNAAVTYA